MLKHAMQRLVVAVLIVGMIVPPTGSARELAGEVEALPTSSGLYRTRVAVRQPADWARLERVGVTVLEQGDDWALVLVDEDQLETLARLRFEPQSTDELGMLVTAHTQAKPWLAASLRPLLAERAADQQKSADRGLDPSASSRKSAVILTPELKAGLTTLSSVDDDDDGLTNTQEQWWCTDPLNPDSDGDGATDGDEVQAAKDWLGNLRGSYPSTGKPFVGWPPDHTGCYDDDQDSIPDLAERWELGLNMNRESTDWDKFDDGQELFGFTYCPGSGIACGYGYLPRSVDLSWGYITSNMPSWVHAPGSHPLVAAYPVIQVDPEPGSAIVTTAEITSTERIVTRGEQHSVGTAKTTGKSTTTGTIDTNTAREWQEMSNTSGGIGLASAESAGPTVSIAFDVARDPRALLRASSVQPSKPIVLKQAEEQYLCVLSEEKSSFRDELSPDELGACRAVFALAAYDRPMPQPGVLSLVPGQKLAVSAIRFAPGRTGQTEAVQAWGIADLVSLETVDGQIIRTNGVALVRRLADTWEATFKGSTRFQEWLASTPDELISDEDKTFLAITGSHQPPPPCNKGALCDYYLPWKPGDTHTLTQGPLDSFSHSTIWAWDFLMDIGTEVRAARSGKVIRVNYDPNNRQCTVATESCYNLANYVIIDHRDETAALYGHLSSVLVGEGKAVARGEPIGYSGNTGYSTDPHLHFQVQPNVRWWSMDTYEIQFSDAGFPNGANPPHQPVTSHNRQQQLNPTPPPQSEPDDCNLGCRIKKAFWNSTLGKLITNVRGSVTRVSGSDTTFTPAMCGTVAVAVSAQSVNSCASQVGPESDGRIMFSDSRTQAQTGATNDNAEGFAVNDNGDGMFDYLPIHWQTETTGQGTETSHSELRSQTEYEELTTSEVNTVLSSEGWSTATTVDSTHAGDLTFEYVVRNVGTDAAISITNLRFNISFGPGVSAITWPAVDNEGISLSNVFPGSVQPDTGAFTAGPIPLSLDQLRAIDEGAPIRIGVASYNYDADEEFYQDALGGSVLFHIDDGIEDSDQTVENYMVPTWGAETYQDVLKRIFQVEEYVGPESDQVGNLVSLRTPEFDSDHNVSGWVTHEVGDHGWWDVSLSHFDPDVTVFKDQPARRRSHVFMTYSLDSDGDRYPDRVEDATGMDKYDSALHPRPLLLAAKYIEVDENQATVQLSLQNNGNYDASSAQALLIAPDDSITVNDGFIGGGGRVRAGDRVVLGARIGDAFMDSWTRSTAKPIMTGQFTGSTPKSYTFTAANNGTVGVVEDLVINWSDGAGNSGSLNIGSGYTPLTPLPVAEGVEVAFTAGDVHDGDSFTSATDLPVDTFTFTINRTPYTPPLVLVSYNDPQGNHKFFTPIEVNQIQTDLTPYQAQMADGLELDILSTADFLPGSNTTYFVFNYPADVPLVDGQLFIEFATADGTVVKEDVVQQTFQPGPNIIVHTWDTANFSPAFDPSEEYRIVAFAADRQGAIIDTDVRYLSDLKPDPKPTFAMSDADAAWDFGTVTQGEILEHTFTFASIGFMDLLTYLSSPGDLSVTGAKSRKLAPGDTTTYAVTLDTRDLPTGPYDETITIRTSDPENPTRTVHVTGTIQAVSGKAYAYIADPYRPWDQIVYIPDPHDAGDVITFTHTITPDAQLVEPLYVYNEEGTLLGVGRAMAFLGDTGWIDLLVFNRGFEEGSLLGWTVRSGGWEVTDYVPHSGTHDARKPGGPHPGYIYRDLSLSAWRSLIDEGLGEAVIGLYSRTDRASGGSMLILRFRQGNTDLAVYQRGCTAHANAWAEDWEQRPIPPGTDNIRAEFGTCDEATLIDDTYVRVRFRYSLHPASSGAMSSATQPPAPAPGVAAPVEHLANLSYLIAGYVTGPEGGANPYPGILVEIRGHGSSYTDQNGRYIIGGLEANRYKVLPNDDRFDIGPVCKWVTVPPSREDVNFVAMPAALHDGATLYEHGNYTGVHETYRGDNADLTESCIGARTVSSLRVRGDYIVVLYSKPHYQGTSETFTGDDPNLGDNIIGNDTVSSIRVIGYIIEKISGSDYGIRFTLPDPTVGGERDWIQYGQRGVYAVSGDHTFHARLPKGRYSSATLDTIIAQAGLGSINIGLDMADDGTDDWTYSGSPDIPGTLTTGDLSAALNIYLAGATPDPDGTVVVPIRVSLNTSGELFLTNFVVTPASDVDVTLDSGDIDFGEPVTFITSLANETPTEGQLVPVQATLHNTGVADSGPLTVAFFATPPDGFGETYIGSDFVTNVSAGLMTTTTIQWNTLGFTGNVPVRVVADPYDRVAETDEDNNEATASLTILTRPDLHVTVIEPSDPEPVAGQPVTVTLTISNGGQTDAGTSALALYDGTPESGGSLLGEGTPAVPGESETTLEFTWTPTAPGPHRLFAISDRDDAVNEFDEGNNQSWQDVYVGFAGPIELNSGGPTASDPPYTSTLGYGVVDEGQADILSDCGSESHQTYRLDPDGRVVYRFDHLLPGHFYHLDLTLYECGQGAGRQEVVKVDDMTVAGPEDLGDGEEHRLSILLDPAFYADRAISVTVEAYEGLGALVNEIALRDVDYRYADSDTVNDPQYPTGDLPYGWLDGSSTNAWGSLPYQTARVDLLDNNVQYQFDELDPLKRYQVHLSFYQGSGNNRVQQVWIDGQPTGEELTIVSGQRYSTTVSVPLTAFQDDGSIVVSAVRTDASVGAMINEIALEEETQIGSDTCPDLATPYWTIAYNNVTIAGQPAPPGTVVTAESPGGDVVGCFIVKQDTPGLYGFMTIYGEDPTANPPIPGMRDGETVIFRVNGALAVPSPPLEWHDDKTPHQVDLEAGITRAQPILLTPGWNLISFYVEPPVPLVDTVLHSIAGKYCLVLGEKDIYDCEVPEHYRSLKELHGGQGYYLRLEGGASANLLVEGVPITPTTPIPLHTAGWNWVGYLPRASQPVTVALQSIDGHYLWVTDGSRFYDPSLPEFSTLTEMEPGDGYLIYATDAVTLTYPSGEGMAAGLTAAAPTGVCPEVASTPYFTLLYGSVNLNGAPAPVGTRMEVVTPRDEVAGCFIVDEAGQYGFMPVYGEDDGNPPIPGFREGELLTLRFNGWYVASVAAPTWTDDKRPHQVDLAVTVPYRLYFPLLR